MGCGTDGVGFVRTPRQPKDMETPFMQFIGLAKHFGTEPKDEKAISKNFNFKEEVRFQSLMRYVTGEICEHNFTKNTRPIY